MSEAAPNLYTGLDQLIAKPTRTERATVPMPVVEASPDATPANGEADKQNNMPVSPETPGNLVRQLEPDPPDAPDLYRKQTINFGPEDLESVHKMQQALRDEHDQETSKQDIVRAGIELLVKDFDLHKEDSFLMRKFVRR